MSDIRLLAPAPGWTVEADVVVVGSGVAGLTTALRCAAGGATVIVVTKDRLDDGSTRWAQGGIAAALGDGDTPEQHLADTLVAGAGLCDEEAVRLLVTEGPARGTAVDRLRGPLRHLADHRRDPAHPRGRPPPQPDRARGRRRHRRRGLPSPGRGGPLARHRDRGERARPRPAHRRGRPYRRRHPARHGRGPPRRGRRGPRPGGRAGHRRHGPGLLRHHQPGRLHRRRRRARAACRCRGQRPGVRAVPPHRAVAGPGRRGPAAAGVGGGAR